MNIKKTNTIDPKTILDASRNNFNYCDHIV